MTFGRDKKFDFKKTLYLYKNKQQISRKDPSWLGHKGKGAILDYELLKGSTKEQLVLNSGRKLSAVNAHIYHLKKEHGLIISNQEGIISIKPTREEFKTKKNKLVTHNNKNDILLSTEVIKIGAFVKRYVPAIFQYCETEDRDELFRLMNKIYSKNTFNINFPFCKEETAIMNDDESVRFWKNNYQIRNKNLRVCSQWIIDSKNLFLDYLLLKGIITENEFNHFHKIIQKEPSEQKNIPTKNSSLEDPDQYYKSNEKEVLSLEKNDDIFFKSKIDKELREEAGMMSKHYEVFYSLERSIRDLILKIMKEKYGNNWWTNRISFDIKRNVDAKIEYEFGSILTKQSERKIDYTTFSELRKIISSNWDIFSKHFNKDKSTFNRIMTDLNKLRNPIAHCTPFIDKEVIRLNLTVDDWYELLK